MKENTPRFYQWGLGSRKDFQVGQDVSSPLSWTDATCVCMVRREHAFACDTCRSEVTSNTVAGRVHLKLCKRKEEPLETEKTGFFWEGGKFSLTFKKLKAWGGDK